MRKRAKGGVEDSKRERLMGFYDKSATPHKNAEFRMGPPHMGYGGLHAFTEDGEDATREREGEPQRASLDLWKAARS